MEETIEFGTVVLSSDQEIRLACLRMAVDFVKSPATIDSVLEAASRFAGFIQSE